MVTTCNGVTRGIERHIQNLSEKRTGGGRNKRERIHPQPREEAGGDLINRQRHLAGTWDRETGSAKPRVPL